MKVLIPVETTSQQQSSLIILKNVHTQPVYMRQVRSLGKLHSKGEVGRVDGDVQMLRLR